MYKQCGYKSAAWKHNGDGASVNVSRAHKTSAAASTRCTQQAADGPPLAAACDRSFSHCAQKSPHASAESGRAGGLRDRFGGARATWASKKRENPNWPQHRGGPRARLRKGASIHRWGRPARPLHCRRFPLIDCHMPPSATSGLSPSRSKRVGPPADGCQTPHMLRQAHRDDNLSPPTTGLWRYSRLGGANLTSLELPGETHAIQMTAPSAVLRGSPHVSCGRAPK